MDTIYVTDGSFEGLLTAIHHVYYSQDTVVDILDAFPMQRDFMSRYIGIQTDEEKAHRVYDAIKKKISYQSADLIMRCYLSELPGCHTMILRYVQLGFKVGSKILDMLTNDAVLPVNKAVYKVDRETHRMLGLCRFAKTEAGYYLCCITPDHNILSLITPHFVSRMGDQPFMILDKRRDMASLYSGQGRWFITSAEAAQGAPWSHDEREFQAMWRRYFETIAIENRTNPRCQRNFMPRRYWVNLTELNEEANVIVPKTL